MTTVLIALGGVITLAGTLPYLIDIVRHKTRPRVVTWFNWTLLSGIATAAAWAGGQYPSAILTLAAAIGTGTIVIFGLRYGEKKIEKFDIFCQVCALAGLVLWFVFDSPIIAVIASAAIDFIAALPTVRHAWQHPGEETFSTFALATIGSACVLAAVRDPHALGLVYPVYMVVMNGVVAGEIIRKKLFQPTLKREQSQ